MPNKIAMVQFIEAINIGGEVVNSLQPKHKATVERIDGGILIKREGKKDRWVPDAQVRWIEFDDGRISNRTPVKESV